jgi:hypothetical protein
MVVIQKLKFRFPACAILTGRTFKQFESVLRLPTLAIRRIIHTKIIATFNINSVQSPSEKYILLEGTGRSFCILLIP